MINPKVTYVDRMHFCHIFFRMCSLQGSIPLKEFVISLPFPPFSVKEPFSSAVEKIRELFFSEFILCIQAYFMFFFQIRFDCKHGRRNLLKHLSQWRGWSKMSVRRLKPLLMNHPERRHTQVLLYALCFSIFLHPIFLPTCSMAMIRSRSAIVVEALTGKVLYAKDPRCRLPPASTAKLMTAIVAMDRLDPWGIRMVSNNASRVPRWRVFKKGDRVTVEQLLYAALIKSANDAAVTLAEAVAGSEKDFVKLMNQKAISIGAENTSFSNSTGLPGPGQYITVFDLSTIMRYALGYPKLREILGTPVAEISTEKGKKLFLKNTDKLLWSDRTLIGGKTGYTFEAGHCFVCAAERQNKRIIVALLKSPSRKFLWKETEELIDKGFSLPADIGQEPGTVD
jgi:serine-type D-Ala-D-Ala carboxypeptidase (penicillin-binding protein 5/6)